MIYKRYIFLLSLVKLRFWTNISSYWLAWEELIKFANFKIKFNFNHILNRSIFFVVIFQTLTAGNYFSTIYTQNINYLLFASFYILIKQMCCQIYWISFYNHINWVKWLNRILVSTATSNYLILVFSPPHILSGTAHAYGGAVPG